MVQEAAQADQMFIGDQIFPAVGSPTELGQYPKFKLATGELLVNDVTARARGASYQRTIRAFETDTFSCVDRGLEELVDDADERDLSRFFALEAFTAKQLNRTIRIGHEVRASTALINAATFTATAASVDYTEANIATIAFHLDVLNAVDRLNAKGVFPNAVVMSSPVFNRVRRSTLAQAFLRGGAMADSATSLLTAEALALSLVDTGITQVKVGRLNRNNAKKGQAFSATPIWPNTHIWVGRIEAGDPMQGGAGRTFYWDKEGGLFVTESYRDESLRSNVIRVRQHDVIKVVDGTSGELITTAYS
jgi:hypothetical protein